MSYLMCRQNLWFEVRQKRTVLEDLKPLLSEAIRMEIE